EQEVPRPGRRAGGGGVPPERGRGLPRLREPLPSRADGTRLGREPVLHRGRTIRAVRYPRRLLRARDGAVPRRAALRPVAPARPPAGRGRGDFRRRPRTAPGPLISLT